MKIQSVRGMNDILGPEIKLWHHIETTVRRVYESFGFNEIRTPVLEMTALFKRGVGADTDIVEKEMYSFEDRSGDHLSLRPEGTAAVVRAVNEHNWLNDHPISKFYYMGPMFRHERPQKGRLRQFHQYGVELIGSESPMADVEVIAVNEVLYRELKVEARKLHISSVGCQNCRPAYKAKLTALLLQHKNQIPEDFHKRIETNPQRIFDRKDAQSLAIAATLPVMLDELCSECTAHFAEVKSELTRLKIDYSVDPKIVRGLDYYNRTAFEFVSTQLGAQSAVGGGGRYDNLIEQLGGKSTPAVGYAGGFERLVLLMEHQTDLFQTPLDIYVIAADEAGFEAARPLAFRLRTAGYRTEIDYQLRPMKTQFRRADKLGARVSIILGETEIMNQNVVVKNMSEQTQETLPIANLDERLRVMLK